ncbi:MAG: tyrosine-type recombinase/integrase, partial [Coriobacteriia bacterium]|nr:tyrosine-type recombinase/integrase [Coriobacteriia bacterium]
CDAYGRPWWPDSFSSAWYQWCKKQGIRCRFHDLRATSGSISLAAGIDPEVVSARLGHHSAAFFLEHYAKPMHSARVRDAGIMGALVAEALDDRTGP